MVSAADVGTQDPEEDNVSSAAEVITQDPEEHVFYEFWAHLCPVLDPPGLPPGGLQGWTAVKLTPPCVPKPPIKRL